MSVAPRRLRPAGHVSAARIVREYLAGTPERSRARYAGQLEEWGAWCAQYPVSMLAVRRHHVEAYIQHLTTDRHLRASTVHDKLNPVRGMYAYAVAEGYLRADPAAGARLPRVVRRSRGTWLTRAELLAVLAQADADPDPTVTALTWLLALHAGRLREALDLDVQDVHTRAGHTIITVTRKGHDEPVEVRLVAPVAERIAAAIGPRASGPVLRHTTGQHLPPDVARKIITGLALQAGIDVPITPHSLRRTFVTLGLDAGIDVRDLMASTGHARPDMLHYYDQGRDAVQRRGADQYAASLGLADAPAPIASLRPAIPGEPPPLTGAQIAALQRLRGISIRRRAADLLAAVVDLLGQGLTPGQIGVELDIRPDQVNRMIRDFELPRHESPNVEPVRRLAAQGLPSTQIAAQVGISTAAVLRLIHSHALPWPRPDAPTPAGRAARSARAAELHTAGVPLHQIAAELDVDTGTVSRYLNGAGVRSNRPWRPDETAVALDPTLTAAQAGQRLRRSTSAVSHERARHPGWRVASVPDPQAHRAVVACAAQEIPGIAIDDPQA